MSVAVARARCSLRIAADPGAAPPDEGVSDALAVQARDRKLLAEVSR